MKKKKRIKITKGEKVLYSMAFFAFLGTLLVQVFCGASVGHMNMNVEVLKYNIETQEKKNESLVMQVNELTAFDKVKDIVAAMGLGYNNENIIVVNE
jgi:cell division protein FtsL